MAPNDMMETQQSEEEKGMETFHCCSDNNRNLVNMAPNDMMETQQSTEEEARIMATTLFSLKQEQDEPLPYTPRIKWPDLCVQIFLHTGAFYGLLLVLTGSVDFRTSVFAIVLVYTSGFGITAGAHRLWSHRAYRATWQLRLLLCFLFTITGQRHIYAWALDHRVHHKYSETNADPHDARRGFWFAHVGWLVLTPRPEVERRRLEVDMSDLERDPIVLWQKRFYVPLFALLAIVLPVSVPCVCWGETLWKSFIVMFNFRFCITLNIAFFVNSAAHMWGAHPYDKHISPSENMFVALAAMGEGWHNYHHVFPYDYKTSELGKYSLNPSTGFIDFFARVGWAHDLKSVTPDMVKSRAMRTGDGTRGIGPGAWGWGDKDFTADEVTLLQEPVKMCTD